MLFNNLVLKEGRSFPTLDILDLATQGTQTILGEASPEVIYSPPSWSPTGEWIVVGLKRSDLGQGRQLWLMRPDGQEGRLITNDPAYSYFGYQWDPWGQAIVAERQAISQTATKPEIVVWSMKTGEWQPLVQDGLAPAWQP